MENQTRNEDVSPSTFFFFFLPAMLVWGWGTWISWMFFLEARINGGDNGLFHLLI